MNKIELKPSLWLYAIHSRNAELIHLLETYQVSPLVDNFERCLSESIKYHRNEIADYNENSTSNNDKIRKSEKKYFFHFEIS